MAAACRGAKPLSIERRGRSLIMLWTMAVSASPDGTIPEQVGNAANSAAQDCIQAGPQDRPCHCRGARRVHQALRVTQLRPSCGSTGSGVDTLWRRQETVRLRFLVAPCPYPVDGHGLPPRRCVAPGRNRAFGLDDGAKSKISKRSTQALASGWPNLIVST